MPRAEDSDETKRLAWWIGRIVGLPEKLAGMRVEELQFFFHPYELGNGPEHIYNDFLAAQYDWDEVDWEVIEEAVQQQLEDLAS